LWVRWLVAFELFETVVVTVGRRCDGSLQGSDFSAYYCLRFVVYA